MGLAYFVLCIAFINGTLGFSLFLVSQLFSVLVHRLHGYYEEVIDRYAIIPLFKAF